MQGLGVRVEAHNDGFSKCKGYVGIIGVPWGLTGSCKSHGFVCGHPKYWDGINGD